MTETATGSTAPSPETTPAPDAMDVQAATDWSQAACGTLGLVDAMRLFYPRADGGGLPKARPWPRPDDQGHATARTICGRCPVIGQCLTVALETDCTTFRGAMTADERVTFGGMGDSGHRRRGVQVDREGVWARLSAVLPEEALDRLAAALAQWNTRLYLDLADGNGDFCLTVGWRGGLDGLADWPSSAAAAEADQVS